MTQRDTVEPTQNELTHYLELRLPKWSKKSDLDN